MKFHVGQLLFDTTQNRTCKYNVSYRTEPYDKERIDILFEQKEFIQQKVWNRKVCKPALPNPFFSAKLPENTAKLRVTPFYSPFSLRNLIPLLPPRSLLFSKTFAF